ncbi:MAG: isopeptide-forming domain-containing fimbrial protein [Clostridia bacterium]|nr:isopeptide-forming domain-containing fimbrial protein [Clostridia bacterium]
MKKLATMFLALVMVLAISIPAFAAENITLTINGEAGREYVGYKLLSLTTSLKAGEHHTTHDGDHTDDCYNFAYTVNDNYRAILQQEVFNNGGNYLWDVKPGVATVITDAQILKYLANQTSDNGDVYQTMRQVADRLYRAIKTAGIAADKTNLTGNNDEITQGYWIFADVTNLTGNAANSLVMVDTKGQEKLTINSKTSLPTVEKKVKDIDDSEDTSILDNAWHDSADHDMGDTIPFKLTATLASNAQYYTAYKIVFHDTLSAGLTLNADSIKVYMYDTKYKADVDIDLNDAAKDVTDNFVKTTTGLTDGCTFEVSCDNVFAIDGVTKDTAFVVYYEAKLQGNDVVIGVLGNSNKVYLEYSNNPYGEGTGKTEEDVVKVFTYKLVINKTDTHGHALAGAGFTLSKKNVDNTYTVIAVKAAGAGVTQFVWEGLDDGDYKLEETTVPEGYNKMSDIVFAISAVHSETDGNPSLISLDGGLIGTGVVDTGAITKDIVNNTGTVLPETGAMGTMWLIFGGAMLVIFAGVFMVTRKKMSVYED